MLSGLTSSLMVLRVGAYAIVCIWPAQGSVSVSSNSNELHVRCRTDSPKERGDVYNSDCAAAALRRLGRYSMHT
jgi:hypothetical protein